MNRFAFLLLIFIISHSLSGQSTISFTFDDGVTNDMPGLTFEEWNEKILGHLDKAGVKAIFFVTGGNKLDEKGRFLLDSWNKRGHSIGNHTFRHPNYNSKDVTFEQFKRQFLKTDSVISQYSNYIRMFRFPYLKEGDTRAKIDSFRTLLEKHQYRNGYVTIDASDWYIDSRLRTKLKKDPTLDVSDFEKYYLAHLLDRAQYYEKLSYALTGRHIHHTILLHHNLTSALFLGSAIDMFLKNGWTVIDAKDAYADEIFKSLPENVPAGEGLIWALAKQSGKFNDILRYPAEDGSYLMDEMDKKGL